MTTWRVKPVGEFSLSIRDDRGNEVRGFYGYDAAPRCRDYIAWQLGVPLNPEGEKLEAVSLDGEAFLRMVGL